MNINNNRERENMTKCYICNAAEDPDFSGYCGFCNEYHESENMEG